MNELLCRLIQLLIGSDRISTGYYSQLQGSVPIAQNPVSVPSVASPNSTNQSVLQILPANRKRKQWILTNVGTVVIVVKLGSAPSSGSSDWTYLLQASGSVGDGSGGVVIDEMWKGSVWVQAASGTGQVNITELS